MEKFSGQIEVYNKEELEHAFPTLEEEAYKETLCVFAERIFTEENKVGFGKTADVYKYPDENTGLCFKHIHNMLPGNNDIDIEIEYLSALQNNGTEVRVPQAFATIVSPMKVRMQEGRRTLVKDHVIVMEYIKGCTVEEAMVHIDQLPEDFNATEFFDKLEVFVEKMHALKIYHRDLHHKNVMIDYATGNPVVIDFGRSARSYLTGESDQEIYASYEMEGDREVRKLLPNDNHYLSEMRKQYEGYLTK